MTTPRLQGPATYFVVSLQKKTQPYNQAVLEVDICALKIIIDICDRLSMILTGSELIITLNTISVSDGE